MAETRSNGAGPFPPLTALDDQGTLAALTFAGEWGTLTENERESIRVWLGAVAEQLAGGDFPPTCHGVWLVAEPEEAPDGG